MEKTCDIRLAKAFTDFSGDLRRVPLPFRKRQRLPPGLFADTRQSLPGLTPTQTIGILKK